MSSKDRRSWPSNFFVLIFVFLTRLTLNLTLVSLLPFQLFTFIQTTLVLSYFKGKWFQFFRIMLIDTHSLLTRQNIISRFNDKTKKGLTIRLNPFPSSELLKLIWDVNSPVVRFRVWCAFHLVFIYQGLQVSEILKKKNYSHARVMLMHISFQKLVANHCCKIRSSAGSLV